MTAVAHEERMIVRCQRCGCRVWKTRLRETGCPTCRTLDTHNKTTGSLRGDREA